jgi:hypothetical protein
VCGSVGFDEPQRHAAIALFQTLTQHSLAAPNVWPTAQLSALSMGQPLEFSATTGGETTLRYTCEVSDPILPAAKRVQTGLAALAATAEQIGCGKQWDALSPIWDVVGTSARPVPAGARFWVWGGVAQPADGLPTLKLYASTLHGESAESTIRLQKILAAANIPYRGQLAWLCERLGAVGFPQEIGVGMRGDGKWGVKIYYELHGWRPALIAEIASRLGFGCTGLVPEIAGVLSAEFAQKRRSGLSFRVHPTSGDILDLTTTAAFPPQLVPLSVTDARITAWLGSSGGAYRRYADLLLPSESSYHRSFSLFTQTVTQTGGGERTVYFRPIRREFPHINSPTHRPCN